MVIKIISIFRKQIRQKEDECDDHSSPESDQPPPGREDRERLTVVMDELRRKEASWRREKEKLKETCEVIEEENENLRLGMHEILNQLRSGETRSIDPSNGVINRLLVVLDKGQSNDQVMNQPIIPKVIQSNVGTQTVSEESPNPVRKTTESVIDGGGFEDLVTNLRDLFEENAVLSEEIKDLKRITAAADDYTEISPSNKIKCSFLLQENAILCNELRISKERTTRVLNKLHQKFIELQLKDIHTAKSHLSSVDQAIPNDHQLIIPKLKAELCKNFFVNIESDELWEKIDAEKKLETVTVIGEDLTTNVITANEYNLMIAEGKNHQEQLNVLRKNNKILEETLLITKEQLEATELALNNQSDGEIALRHLVVDLQSTGSDKQLLARAHRDQMAGE